MLRFFSREADVLLATTIVENGLDIPSANTILIDRAETFGLAQLYQLRGRVGRSDKPAYAYLLVARDGGALGHRAAAARLDPGVLRPRRRLPHRREGPRDPRLGQHPRRRAVRATSRPSDSRRTSRCSRRRSARCAGEEPLPERAVTLSLGLDLAIPHDVRRRRELADDDLQEDRPRAGRRGARGDRAARSPTGSASRRRPSRRLIEYARLRSRAERLGVTSITRQAGQVHVRFAEDAPVDADRLLDVRPERRGASLSPARVLTSARRPPGDGSARRR